MEKRKPHHNLLLMQKLIRAGDWQITITAQKNAYEL